MWAFVRGGSEVTARYSTYVYIDYDDQCIGHDLLIECVFPGLWIGKLSSIHGVSFPNLPAKKKEKMEYACYCSHLLSVYIYAVTYLSTWSILH